MKKLILMLFVVTNFGVLLGAAITFNNLITNIAAKLETPYDILTSKFSLFWLIVPALCLMPILVKRKLKDAAFLTFISLGSAFYIVGLLIICVIIFKENAGNNPATPIKKFDYAHLPGTFALSTFSLLCQPNVMSIYNELKVKSISNMRKMTFIHLGFMSFIYVTMALVGYLLFYKSKAFGEKPILELFDDETFPFIFADILMTISALNSFIFSFKPLKDTIVQQIQGETEESKNASLEITEEVKEESDYNLKNVLITFCLLVFLITISGALIKNECGFNDIMDYLCGIVLPVLFVFLPLYAYLGQKKSKFVMFVLAISVLLYIWTMFLYGDKAFHYFFSPASANKASPISTL
jgi:amino acid permease